MGELRRKTAHVMRASPNEYLPYITSPTGDMLDKKLYEEYLDALETTHEWGGHVEVLKHVMHVDLY